MEGPTKVNRHSVISQGHYVGLKMPDEVLQKVLEGRNPKLLMDIHSVSGVNRQEIELSEIPGPAHSEDFASLPGGDH